MTSEISDQITEVNPALSSEINCELLSVELPLCLGDLHLEVQLRDALTGPGPNLMLVLPKLVEGGYLLFLSDADYPLTFLNRLSSSRISSALSGFNVPFSRAKGIPASASSQ